MDSKTVTLNFFLTLGDLENEPISKKVECSFKAAVRKFSLCRHLFENLELQLCAELSSLCGLYSGTASARMNLMFWGECVAVTAPVWMFTVLGNHRF